MTLHCPQLLDGVRPPESTLSPDALWSQNRVFPERSFSVPALAVGACLP